MNRIHNFVEEKFAFNSKPNLQELKEKIKTGLTERYEELLAQGKSRDEAFDIIVSKFGDLNETETDFLQDREDKNQTSKIEIKDLIKDFAKRIRKPLRNLFYVNLIKICTSLGLFILSFFVKEQMTLVKAAFAVLICTDILFSIQAGLISSLEDFINKLLFKFCGMTNEEVYAQPAFHIFLNKEKINNAKILSAVKKLIMVFALTAFVLIGFITRLWILAALSCLVAIILCSIADLIAFALHEK
ncbi:MULTISPECIES: permease prefix domain 1-containing protein [unclassified Treponema]|uniref:permease prefix domain 1-containing protein n=1 Tax=unclassified Treponema TaxID=2638727 RepID=UPI0020A42438|nr:MULTISPECIES: permease prefix domain 1-containing protein [unclassified Treponema]UTC66948.1 hypothetical protein E4O06_13550 [Treponema sp. OMZ 789]UTC69677.1 hypothetical protein E4O01_13690 [Treponema sp. OMZ 790]UTC72391.1 hypothetical protein E4O02_13780 [Treponema sp. OMZ 791]